MNASIRKCDVPQIIYMKVQMSATLSLGLAGSLKYFLRLVGIPQGPLHSPSISQRIVWKIPPSGSS